MNALLDLARNRERSVFYHLDLGKAARELRENGLALPPEPGPAEPVVRRISDSMFRAVYHNKGEEAKKWGENAFGLLREEMIATLASEPLEPHRKMLDDQILWGRSPVRLDLAGGWTDTPPHCILEGGRC
ncbi:MAG: hypothetical protein R2751_01245 [Bacteroidales bacterium]